MVEGVPSRPDTFYFGAAGGGLWRTDNAGRTWTSLFDKGPTAPIGAIAVAPSQQDIGVPATGEPMEPETSSPRSQRLPVGVTLPKAE